MLYLHIPFCKQACTYCDFYFVTQTQAKAAYVKALGQELVLRKEEINPALISIYFGGGTPSLLEEAELAYLMEIIHKHYKVPQGIEITLEANPEDMKQERIKAWLGAGINRLSVGVQSFEERDLLFMHRNHTGIQAETAIKTAQDAGIENISLDLIYGTPNLTDLQWHHNLEKAIQLEVPHISSYALTVEPKTALHKQITQKKIAPLSETQAEQQFGILMDTLAQAGFEHYEISNFAKPHFYAQHNTHYWKYTPYLGVGTAAHSFDGSVRRWNVKNITHYCTQLDKQQLAIEEEEKLTPTQKINEQIMTGLRTQWGVSLDLIQQQLETDYLTLKAMEIEQFINKNLLFIDKNTLYLTYKGKFFADYITVNLIV